MTLIKFVFIFLLLGTSAAFAADSYEASYEDVQEFISATEDENLVEPKETWAYHFELIHKTTGATTVLSTQDSNVLVKPASTMKLFTGWWAFKMKNRTTSYLYQMLRTSSNSMAEATVQRMGGVFAMQDWYVEQGLAIDETNFIPADGSGLSYDNRATCGIEISLLKMMKNDASYSRFKKLLAQPGKDGTLRSRLTAYSGLLFAKTGTLKRTASLSGFLESPKGTIVFCVLSDYLNINLTLARKKIDAMVKKNYILAKKTTL